MRITLQGGFERSLSKLWLVSLVSHFAEVRQSELVELMLFICRDKLFEQPKCDVFPAGSVSGFASAEFRSHCKFMIRISFQKLIESKVCFGVFLLLYQHFWQVELGEDGLACTGVLLDYFPKSRFGLLPLRSRVESSGKPILFFDSG